MKSITKKRNKQIFLFYYVLALIIIGWWYYNRNVWLLFASVWLVMMGVFRQFWFGKSWE